MDPLEIRKLCPRFRILVIGRANAGKTTLLKKVCMSTEDPEVFDAEGNKLDASIVEGSKDRGEHNIENQLVFKSNPGFVFHDSRGFESGSENETEMVKSFITRRANVGDLKEQLHAIWYCLATDTNRSLLKADVDFFNTAIRGKVPLIAIFTKFDALVSAAFKELKESGHTRSQSQAGKLQHAEKLFEEHFLAPLQSTHLPPSDFLHVSEMHQLNSGSDCIELVEKTAGALTDESLTALFVSVQQVNIDLAIQYGLTNALNHPASDYGEKILVYVVHPWVTWLYPDSPDLPDDSPNDDEDFLKAAQAIMTTIVVHSNQGPQYLPWPIIALAATCICLEQTFTEASASESHFPAAFEAAFTAYTSSPISRAVEHAVKQLDLSSYMAASKEQQHGETDMYTKAKKLGSLMSGIFKANRLRLGQATDGGSGQKNNVTSV